jgi:hypothetical protein
LFIDRTKLLALQYPLLPFLFLIVGAKSHSIEEMFCYWRDSHKHVAQRGIPINNCHAPFSVMSYNFRILRIKMANQVDILRMNVASSKWSVLRIGMLPVHLND